MIKKGNLKHIFLVCLIIISCIFLVFSLNFLQINQKNSTSNYNIMPKSAQIADPLYYDAININKSSIYQHFESINIQVNVSQYEPFENHTEVQLSDLYGHTELYNMTRINSEVFSFNYSTNKYFQLHGLPSQLLDFINVNFFVYNESRYLLNSHSTSKNFTIKPNCRINFDKSSYSKENPLVIATLEPNYLSESLYGWNSYNVSIDDDLEYDNGNLFNIPGYNQSYLSFEINDSFSEVNNNYFARLNLINSTNQIVTTSYYSFLVENSNPRINTSSVTLNSTSIFRSNVDNCLIELNASDLDSSPPFVNVSLFLERQSGETHYVGILENNQDGSFKLAFHAPYDLTPGTWKIKLTATDPDGGSYNYTYGTTLEINNNPPKIYGYKINGLPITQGISIYYGEPILFTFNVSDKEDGNDLNITVVLISSDNKRIERTAGPDLTITFSSYELITGIWYVYVYVEDSDGTIVSLTDDYNLAPQAINIVSDLLGPVLPWIALIIGLIIGALIGVGLGYYRIKTKILEGQEIKPKKKTEPKKKKISGKKVIKESLKSSDTEEKRDEEIEEKAEPDKKIPQRKIKRKL